MILGHGALECGHSKTAIARAARRSLPDVSNARVLTRTWPVTLRRLA